MPDPKYTLHFKDFKMTLELVKIRDLLPHEEIIPELLEKLAQDIEKDGVMKHPVIVDEDTLVVLDGNHRTEALKKLGYQYIPACLVDYQSPLIGVRCWYRTIEGSDHGRLAKTVEDFGNIVADWEKIVENINSTNALAIVMRDRVLISAPFKSLTEAYEALRKVEYGLRSSGFRIGYVPEEMAFKKVLEDSILAYVAMPPLTKDIIVGVAKAGRCLPCKTSRHSMPARPMGVDLPLKFLKGHPLDEANREFYLWISKRNVSQIPPRSVFEGRRYDECIFFFHQ